MSNLLFKDDVDSSTQSSPVLAGMYMDAISLVERLHRGLLDLIKDEFERCGISEINAVQGLILFNMGDDEMTAGELRTRGHYMGSNVSYNLKKMVDMGYVEHHRSRQDRRTVRVKLTAQGQEIRRIIQTLYERQVEGLQAVGELNTANIMDLIHGMSKLERYWGDHIRFRM